MKELICYCFEYTEQDILDDLNRNKGKSSILAKIAEARKSNNCRCDVQHPEKR
jgi:hypothetical protein